ncbi:MAG: bifunctional pyr operon transcriptional regulator/uracil phosphoribosyltransferase PyrR [bacterium]
MPTVLLDAEAMKRTLGRMVHEILDRNNGAEELVVVGVLRRGYPVAKRLAFLLTQASGFTVPLGKVDVRSLRDDSRRTTEDESEIPFELKGRKVILVDEVMYTGRTVRAALESLLMFGRPNNVQLAVLIDRGHRELPIQPDYVGRHVRTNSGDHITVMVREFDGEDKVVLETESERKVTSQ